MGKFVIINFDGVQLDRQLFLISGVFYLFVHSFWAMINQPDLSFIFLFLFFRVAIIINYFLSVFIDEASFNSEPLVNGEKLQIAEEWWEEHLEYLYIQVGMIASIDREKAHGWDEN